jgi:hypothetical protein
VVQEMQDEFDVHGISRPDTLIGLAEKLDEQASAAADITRDPTYRLAGLLPFVGDNLRAVGKVASAVEAIAHTLPAGARLTGSLDASHLLPHAGSMDMDVVKAGSQVMLDLDGAVERATQIVGSIDRSRLVGPIDSAVLDLQGQLPGIAALSHSGANLARLVTPMLGSERERTYLLVFQNSAEPRATGGIFGAYAALGIDNGRLKIVDQGSASRDLGMFTEPVGRVDPDIEHLYGNLVATYAMDVNFSPQFPAAASRFAEMYTVRTGRRVDGVIAIDPYAISRILAARPPIELADGEVLDSSTVEELLLSAVYQRFPHSSDAPARDAYLASVTSAAFSAMVAGGGDLRATISNVKDMVDERRVMIWSAHPSEQRVLDQTPVSGLLPVDPPTRPSVGVFLNEGTGSKLGYYLDGAATLTPGDCRSDGTREIQVAVALTDSSPSAGLPAYVLGGSNPDYRLQLNTLIFAPTGGVVRDIRVDGHRGPALSGSDAGRSVIATTVVLTPGRSTTITAVVTVPPGATSTVSPWLITTPGVREWNKQAGSFEACP